MSGRFFHLGMKIATFVLFGTNGFTPELVLYASKRLDVLLLK